MKNVGLFLFLVALLTLPFFFSGNTYANTQSQAVPDVYVGVHLGYGDVAEAKALIDRVSGFTNFVMIGTSKIFYNSIKLNDTFQYAFDHGMSFMSFTPSLQYTTYNSSIANQTVWFQYANETWGNHLVGFYQDDEPGGKALDGKQPIQVVKINGGNGTFFGNVTFTAPSSNTEAADAFVANRNGTLTNVRNYQLNQTNYPLFTSDYGAYWFDYKAGYDGLFAEFVANYSRQMIVSLVRGAATVQNKQWGILIGWKYSGSPYLESGDDLYKDMVFAYDAGAKYILIYDANEGWTQDILQPEHIQAMQQFWEYVQNNPRQSHTVSERSALLLPDDYGCGFRWPGEKIWGIFPQDETSAIINAAIGRQLEVFGDKLDVIYDDGLTQGSNYGYSQLLYWNDPSLQPTPSPSPTPSPTPTPTATPTPTLSPTPSPSPSPSPTPTPTISPSPTPTVQPTAIADPPYPIINYVYAATTGVTLIAVVAGAFFVRKRRNHAKS